MNKGRKPSHSGRPRIELVYQVLRPDLILAGSQFYARRAHCQGRSDSTVRIVHGIDTGRFRPDPDRTAARRARGLPVDAQILLCAARLTPRKGIPDLLSATARLWPMWPRLYLVVAGTVNSSDRGYADFLHAETARLGIAERVTFEGMCTQSICRGCSRQPTWSCSRATRRVSGLSF